MTNILLLKRGELIYFAFSCSVLDNIFSKTLEEYMNVVHRFNDMQKNILRYQYSYNK